MSSLNKFAEIPYWQYQNLRNVLWDKPSEMFNPAGPGAALEKERGDLSDSQLAGIHDDEIRSLLAYPLLGRVVSPSGLERAALRDFSDEYQPKHFFSFERWNKNRTLNRYRDLLRQLDRADEFKSSPLSRLSFEELDRMAKADPKNQKKWMNDWLPDKKNPHYNKKDRYLLNAHIQAMSRAAQAELKRREHMGEV